MSTILVTGAAGYLGTHILLELFQAGHHVVAVDNFSNSKPEALKRVQAIAGHQPVFYQADVCDRTALDAIFSQHAIDAVIHLAALKSVGESVAQPLRYYQNNISGTLNLLAAMQQANVCRIVFSSSATVYKNTTGTALTEEAPLGPCNPYGHSKLMVEDILRDLSASQPGWHIALLRYFNPVGAHESGLIGEDPRGIPNNLMPYISQVASGKLSELQVFGGDYPTPDGTGVRDYIHVVDLAQAHIKALTALSGAPNTFTLNLATGRGYSVLEIIQAFATVSGKNIPYRITARRSGDVACCYADPSAAEERLGWKAEKTLEQMCRDSWRWQQLNPCGYPDASD